MGKKNEHTSTQLNIDNETSIAGISENSIKISIETSLM